MRYAWILVLLAGCATTAEQEARQLAAYEKRCESLGFQRDTAEMRECKLRLYSTAAGAAAATR